MKTKPTYPITIPAPIVDYYSQYGYSVEKIDYVEIKLVAGNLVETWRYSKNKWKIIHCTGK